MELEQWIAVYSAASQSAASRERSLWSVFAGGLIASSLMLSILAIAVTLTSAATLTATDFGRVFGIGIAALGLAICLVWALIQYKLLHECRHYRTSTDDALGPRLLYRKLCRVSHWDLNQLID